MRFSSLNNTPYESRRIGPCTLLLKSMPRLPWVSLTSTINVGEAHAVLSAIIIGGRQTIALILGLSDWGLTISPCGLLSVRKLVYELHMMG